MVSFNNFLQLITNNLSRKLDPNQQDAVSTPASEALFLVAGPGSGKTTVLALRVLKFIFVDGIDPAEILATTFTRKAAAELRSYILGWETDCDNLLLACLISIRKIVSYDYETK